MYVNGVILMEEISMEMFGTTDYQYVLDAMSPHDSLVKEFKYRTGMMTRPAVVVKRKPKLWSGG